VAAPLLVQSATLLFAPGTVTVQRLAARLEGTNTIVEGTLTIPRECTGTACASTFDLKAAELSLDEVNRVLNPRYRSTDWLTMPRIFSGKTVKASRLMTLQARGNITIGRLQIKNLVATRATARLDFDRGQIGLSDLRADLLTGRHQGNWRADLTGAEPVFTGQGIVETLPLAQLNALLRSPLGAGTLRLTYDLTMRGADAASLRTSTAGQATFRWMNGTWRTSGAAPAVQFSEWTGALKLRDEAVDLTESLMQTRTGPYQVSGRAGFDRELSLRLSGPRDQMLVSGPLQSATLAISQAEGLPAADSASNLKNASPAKVRN
ncbi:MAG: AsmA family protein, partial [Terriglobales bacterium]